MRQISGKQDQAANSSANTSSVQVPVQPDSAPLDTIHALNGASPLILLIGFTYAGKLLIDSVCRLVETIKEK